MKTASLPESSVVTGAHAGSGRRIRDALLRLKHFIRRQNQVFPAIALAEAGDHDGAVELLHRRAEKKT